MISRATCVSYDWPLVLCLLKSLDIDGLTSCIGTSWVSTHVGVIFVRI